MTQQSTSVWGSNGFKNAISLGTLVLSIVTAVFAIQARDQAAQAKAAATTLEQELDRNRHASALTHQSLPFLEKMRSADRQEAETACLIVVSMRDVQFETTERHDIGDLLDRMLDANIFDAAGLCALISQENAGFAQRVAVVQTELSATDDIADTKQEAETKVIADLAVEAQASQTVEPSSVAGRDTIGTYHAVMASYQSQNCALAQGAATAFSTVFESALSGKDPSLGLTQRKVSIYRTTLSDHYAVVIDMGDDQNAASRWAEWLRVQGVEAAQRVADKTTTSRFDSPNIQYLTGAFVQKNRGWYLDAQCLPKS